MTAKNKDEIKDKCHGDVENDSEKIFRKQIK
jgi:hypothetical protein